MRKSIYILFFLLVALKGYAQDFQPGQQAQNLLEHKNVMVDYSTGLFHYTVPVCKLNSGNYELPISLDYIGDGVKVNDSSGLMGHNWTLNTGGVVTRTVRGGYPDEAAEFGYLWTANNATPLKDDLKNVSLRKRDGESDIFTAVFNGKRVNFIIRLDGNRKIYAEPLEYTNVRIECEAGDYFIYSWNITDENGDRYIYKQREMTALATRLDVSSMGSICSPEYVSSWYLTKIIPFNSAPIEFLYKSEAGSRGSGVKKTNVSDKYKIKYTYGRPVKEYPFDFSRYRDEFESCIEEARSYIEASSMQMDTEYLQMQKSRLKDYDVKGFDPFDSSVARIHDTNFRIIGLLGEMKNATVASENLINTLVSMINYYNQFPGSKTAMAASYLSSAKRLVHSCLTEMNNITSKEIYGGTSSVIYSPVLAMITTPDRIVEFGYRDIMKIDKLKSITLCDWFKNPISSVSLVSWNHFLDAICYLDKNGVETSNILFDYYDYSSYPPLKGIEPDFWGYPQPDSDTGKNEAYDLLTALYSLKCITLPNGGKVEIAYEKNQANFKVGGIRLKSLACIDGVTGKTDSISYNYPIHGEFVFEPSTPYEEILYGRFSDKIRYDRIRLKGHPFLNLGNNGVYYPYVTETIQGKGTSAYLYHVAGNSGPNYSYLFWLNCLPLGKALYDEQGKLKQMVKYKYAMALGSYSPPFSEGTYFIDDPRLAYNRVLPQLQASDYFLDGDELKKFYDRQITNYIDGPSLYESNIKPRLSPIVKPIAYELRYGGKVMLKEELDYRFDNNKTGIISYNDFSMDLKENLYCKTEYAYDNIYSSFPTRVDRIGTDGNINTKICKRVDDVAKGVDLVIDKMKQRNMLSPIVKQLTLSNNKVLNEVVYRYHVDEQPDSSFISLNGQFSYTPDNVVAYSESNGKDNLLFTYGEVNYDKIASCKSERNKVSYLLTEENGRVEKKSYAYDPYGRLLLECDGLGGAATTTRVYNSEELKNVSFAKLVYQQLPPLSYYYERMQMDPIQDEEFNRYCDSEEHQLIISYVKENLKDTICPNLDYIMYLQTGITIDNNRMLNEFERQYNNFIKTHPRYKSILSVINILKTVVTSPEYADAPLAKYLYQINYQKDSPYCSNSSIHLTTIPKSKRLKLYVLGGDNDASCTVTHSGGITKYTATANSNNSSSSVLKVFDIDLSAYQDITAIDITSWDTYMALVPEGFNFKATSYNTDGTVYAKFNQSGNFELYTYDSAGRITQIKDQYRNLLKEYEYNQIINQ